MVDIRNNAQNILKDYPSAENWRFFIDGYRQREGKWAFDTGAGAEKGYYAAMQGSWDRMLNTLAEPLSVNELQNIHEYCVGKGEGQTGVDGVVDTTEYRTKQGDLGLVSQESDAFLGNVSLKGATEIFQKVLINDPNFPQLTFVYFNESGFSVTFEVDQKASAQENAKKYCELINNKGGKLVINGNAEEFVRRYIKEYRLAIKHAHTEDEKLLAIADCVSQIEIVHPFYDGNCRTMIVLTNKLLLQNGLSPCIFENPNRIDMFSKAEIVNEIKKGQALVNEYKTTAAANAIQSLTPTDLQNKLKIEKAIIHNISQQPLQSLEQLHQLFEKIQFRKVNLQTKKSIYKTARTSFLDTHASTKVKNNNEQAKQNALLIMIQSIYASRLEAISKVVQKLHHEVDDLKSQKEQLNVNIQEIIKRLSEPNAETVKLRRELDKVEDALSQLNCKVDRASKAEQWYVDRFDEMKQHHKNIMTTHTSSTAKKSIESTFDDLYKVAKRVVTPQVVRKAPG